MRGIEADEAQCAYWLERSPALVTALAPKIGYAEAAEAGQGGDGDRAHGEGSWSSRRSCCPPEELEEVLDLRAMTEIGVPGGKGIPAGG